MQDETAGPLVDGAVAFRRVFPLVADTFHWMSTLEVTWLGYHSAA